MNYIEEYHAQIKNGEVTVGWWIKSIYDYIEKHLKAKDMFVYDDEKAQKAITYIQNFCHHHEGALAPQLIKLELWQKAIVSSIFGLVEPDSGLRWFREVVIVIARKNGKTLFASAIASYMMFCDGEHGAKIYFTAPKLEQAELCYDAFYQSILQEEELKEAIHKRRSDLYAEFNNSKAKPLAFSAKKSDGLNIHLGICDEISSWQGTSGLQFYEVLKSSFGSRTQPILLSISTSGYENNGVYDELVRRSQNFLKGTSKEKRILPFLYMVDDATKWNDLEELKKSNPNLGVSVQKSFYEEEIAIAESSPTKKAEFLMKYCNVKQNSTQAWFNVNDIEKVFTKSFSLEDLRNSYAVLGVDLSRTTDLTSLVVLVEKDGELYAKQFSWLPESKIDSHTQKEKIPYGIYLDRQLIAIGGEEFIDYNLLMEEVRKLLINYEIYPIMVGYDTYSSQYLINDMKNSGLQTDSVRQGPNLTPVIEELEGIVKAGKIHFDKDDDLAKLHILNSAIKKNNTRGTSQLVKADENGHIDIMAALLCAMCVRQKWYNELGPQLANN